VLADERLIRGRVDAVRPNGAGVVDHHVAVLPCDLREVTLDDRAGAAADVGHLVFLDVELPDDHESGHVPLRWLWSAEKP
jgi:hypothetical protein